MDSITQGLLGGAIAQLGFRQRIGRDATWVAAAAAVVPDLDILIPPVMGLLGMDVGAMERIVIHRGWSHALLAAPLLALPMALLWWALRRRRVARPASFWLLYSLVIAAVVSQPLLDVCTSYGTQIFLPFSQHRYALDAVPIVDIFYTPALIITLATCYLFRRIRGQQPSRRATLWMGWSGILLTTGYLVAGRLAHDAVIERGRSALRGEQIERIEAYPMIPTILLWRVVARLPDQWVAMRVHLLGAAPRMRSVPSETDRWVARAKALPEAQTFNWFTGDMVRYAARRTSNGHVVELHDMRYAMSPEGIDSLWRLRVSFTREGSMQQVVFDRQHRRVDMGAFVKRVWRETWNP